MGYPFKLTSPMNEKEYLIIGRHSDLGDDGKPALLQPVFVWVPRDQEKATMKPIDQAICTTLLRKIQMQMQKHLSTAGSLLIDRLTHLKKASNLRCNVQPHT